MRTFAISKCTDKIIRNQVIKKEDNMKIGFDAKRAMQNHTGLGNYSRFIIDIMSRFYPQENYQLYAPRHRENHEMATLLQRPNVSICYPQSAIWQKAPSLWRTWGMSHRFHSDGLDLFHGLSNELPLNIKQSGVKSIVTIHDLIFLRYPQFYAPVDRHLYAYKYRKACENCDHIIAISQMTKRDIMRLWGIEEKKISVVYQGCNSLFKQPVSPEQKEEIKHKYGLPEHYILYVGSIEERKNLLLIIQALSHLPNNVRLVALGRHTPYVEKVKDYMHTHHLEKRVQLLHGIPLFELPAFYQCASLFVYPSRFEGFGIPIIEAIHSGVPVIAATGSCLEEAGGPASVYVDPDDADQLAQNILQILSDNQRAEEMRQESLKYVQRFTDQNIATNIQHVYEQITK